MQTSVEEGWKSSIARIKSSNSYEKALDLFKNVSFLPAILKLYANENCVKRCLLPRDQDKSEAYRGSFGAGACTLLCT